MHKLIQCKNPLDIMGLRQMACWHAWPNLLLLSISIIVHGRASSFAFNDFITSLGGSTQKRVEAMIKGGYRVEDALADLCVVSVGSTAPSHASQMKSTSAMLH